MSSTSAAFPAGAIPLATVTLDGVGRCQSVLDSRSSSLSSAPTIGSGTMFEVVSDATKRVNFQNNYYVPRTYSVGPALRPDVDLPCSGFFLGAGQVNTGSSVVSTPKTWISSAIPRGPAPQLQIQAAAANQPNVTNYLFIDPASGNLSTNTSGRTVNKVNIATVVTDSVSLIRQINDLRPSYI